MKTQNNTIEVVAALLKQDGKYLVFQRPPQKARGLLWEFVGGKIEKGETPQEALVRECMEELGVTITAGEPFMDVTHEYPDITVHLTVLHAAIRSGEVQLLEHAAMRAVTADEMLRMDFCPADEVILHRIQSIEKES